MNDVASKHSADRSLRLVPAALRYMPYALTETLAILLVCGLAYHSLVMFEAAAAAGCSTQCWPQHVSHGSH